MKLEYEISTVLGALSGFGCFLLSHFCCEQFADPLWEERNGKIDAIADFTLVKVK